MNRNIKSEIDKGEALWTVKHKVKFISILRDNTNTREITKN